LLHGLLSFRERAAIFERDIKRRGNPGQRPGNWNFSVWPLTLPPSLPAPYGFIASEAAAQLFLTEKNVKEQTRALKRAIGGSNQARE